MCEKKYIPYINYILIYTNYQPVHTSLRNYISHLYILPSTFLFKLSICKSSKFVLPLFWVLLFFWLY